MCGVSEEGNAIPSTCLKRSCCESSSIIWGSTGVKIVQTWDERVKLTGIGWLAPWQSTSIVPRI